MCCNLNWAVALNSKIYLTIFPHKSMLFLSKSFVFYAISLLFWWISFTIKDAQQLDRRVGTVVHRFRRADNIWSFKAGYPTVLVHRLGSQVVKRPAATIDFGCSPNFVKWSALVSVRFSALMFVKLWVQNPRFCYTFWFTDRSGVTASRLQTSSLFIRLVCVR